MARKKDDGQLELGLLGGSEDVAKAVAPARTSQPMITAPVATVAVVAPLDRVYSYAVPEAMLTTLKPGMVVRVPMGRGERLVQGFCLAVSEESFTTGLKPVAEIVDDRVLIGPKLLELGRWMSEYYASPPGLAMTAVVPASVVGSTSGRTQPHIRCDAVVEPTFGLNDEQQMCLTKLEQMVDAAQFRVALVHGVTASGKTEVYIRAIRRAIAAGKSAIYLVPEIALTAQMIHRLAARLESVAVLHSGLTEAQRRATWHAVARGEAKVVIGTRSAVFAPLPNLGLIVIDEEHEGSFKNLASPRYHTRDLAIKRAHIEGLPIILGSATPSLESYHNSRENPNWVYLRLAKRVADLPMPKVSLVDMQQEMFERRGVHLVSRLMEARITETLDAGKQVMLLLNRRGYASYIFCPSCKYVMVCPNCKINLVYHKESGKASCHRCSAKIVVPDKCDRCGHKMNKFGLGTERVEEELTNKFPGVAIARMDTDTMTRVADYEAELAAFAEGRTRILLGTQMIAKGLDFPNVAMVGVLSADLALSMPDFRSSERTFQLVAQVAGRAGRADHAGVVVVQSYNLNSPAIQAALNHDYDRFAQQELTLRKKLALPPFHRLTRLVLQHRHLNDAQKMAKGLVEKFTGLIESAWSDVAVYGPNPCAIARMRGVYRWQILIKAPSAMRLQQFLSAARAQKILELATKGLIIDVDPVDLL